jgi:hypothetical protein
MRVAALRLILHEEYRWALDLDLSSESSRYWTWYKDHIGEYPGVIPRTQFVGGFKDYARDIPGGIQRLDRDAAGVSPDMTVGVFIAMYPQHRAMIQWVQTARGLRYATVRMNILDQGFEPMTITRFVLEALKGFEKMEPVEAHGGRAILLQGAPLPDEIASGTDDLWMYPAIPSREEISS